MRRVATRRTTSQVVALRAPCNLRELPQPLRVLACQRAADEAPAPVVLRVARTVHARIAAEAEDVLHRDDRGLRDRRVRRADQRPCDVVALWSEVRGRELPFSGRRAL